MWSTFVLQHPRKVALLFYLIIESRVYNINLSSLIMSARTNDVCGWFCVGSAARSVSAMSPVCTSLRRRPGRAVCLVSALALALGWASTPDRKRRPLANRQSAAPVDAAAGKGVRLRATHARHGRPPPPPLVRPPPWSGAQLGAPPSPAKHALTAVGALVATTAHSQLAMPGAGPAGPHQSVAPSQHLYVGNCTAEQRSSLAELPEDSLHFSPPSPALAILMCLAACDRQWSRQSSASSPPRREAPCIAVKVNVRAPEDMGCTLLRHCPVFSSMCGRPHVPGADQRQPDVRRIGGGALAAHERVYVRGGVSTLERAAALHTPLLHHIFLADPSARVFAGELWLYVSHDRSQPVTAGAIGAPAFDMDDSWIVRFASPQSPAVDAGASVALVDVPWAVKQMWAPDAAQDSAGVYHVFFPAKDTEGTFRIGEARAETPAGPFEAAAEPLDGIHGIDPCVLGPGDGRPPLLFVGGLAGGQLEAWRGPMNDKHGRELARGPLVAELSADMRSIVGEATEVVILGPAGRSPLIMADRRRRFYEGAWVHERNGTFYLSYSTGSTHRVCYATSHNPRGPYRYRGVLLARVHSGWTTQHSIVEFAGEWWLFYHDSELSFGESARRNVKVAKLEHVGRHTMQTIGGVPWARGPAGAGEAPGIPTDEAVGL